MILWTIQSEAAFKSLCENGVLRVGKDITITEESLFKDAYTWMNKQMESRLGPAPLGATFPIWAWYRLDGKRKRPDMRSHRDYGKPGERIVLLTLDVPDEKVLLSDFDYWHCVLSKYPISTGGRADEDYTIAEMEESFKLIFDWECSFEEEPSPYSTQACMWELKMEWVKKIEWFKSSLKYEG